MLIRSLLSVLIVACSLGTALAQPADDLGPDLPAPARLAVVEGTTWFWRPGDSQWTPAQLNTAVVAGDALATADRSNIEVQIGPRDFVRMMGDSQLVVSSRDVGGWRFRVPAGNVSFDLRGLSGGQKVELETPNALFVTDRSGYYRIDVRPGYTSLTVRNGGYAFAPSLRRAISAGEMGVVRGESATVFDLSRAAPPDEWDRWNDARSDYVARAASYRYLPADAYGAAELDQYGSWRDTRDYGAIWVPSVASGWTPFSRGVWRWDPIYEWTWVDQAPWGWATAHYGRWVYVDGYWAWAPGPRMARATYLPATVAFYGADGNVAVGVSPFATGVSWVALGWGEPVLPWWGHREYRGRPSWGGWYGPRVVNNIVIDRHERIEPERIHFHHREVYVRHIPERRPDDYRPGYRERVAAPDWRDRPPGGDSRPDLRGRDERHVEHGRPGQPQPVLTPVHPQPALTPVQPHPVGPQPRVHEHSPGPDQDGRGRPSMPVEMPRPVTSVPPRVDAPVPVRPVERHETPVINAPQPRQHFGGMPDADGRGAPREFGRPATPPPSDGREKFGRDNPQLQRVPQPVRIEPQIQNERRDAGAMQNRGNDLSRALEKERRGGDDKKDKPHGADVR